MRGRNRLSAGAIVIVAAIGLATPASLSAPAAAAAGKHAPPFRQDTVLVRFAPGTAASARASARAAAGTDLQATYRIVPGLQRLRVRPGRTVEETVAALSRNPNVIYAEPDYVVHSTSQPNDPSYGSLWGMANIRAPAAWDVTTGSGDVVVAIIDTGVDGNHPDLSDNLWTNPDEIAGNGIDDDNNGYLDDVHGWDFVDDDNDPSDGHGHGTHVAGTVGAVGNNGIGVVGVNWRVKLVALKFIDDSGVGYESDAVRALQYAKDKGVLISNNSWGGFDYSQALYDAIANMRADGHVFVTAAGNYSFDNDLLPFYPASFGLENIISVASITSADELSDFSNYGATSVHIGAPGSSIYSTVPGGYATFSGTSMATPHVTGAAALLLSEHPSWTYGQLRTTILDSARPIAALSGITVTGGTLDLYAALTASTVFPTFDLAPSSLAFGEQAVGGTSAAQDVTLTNTGTLVLPISSITDNSTAFVVSHTCGSSVAVGASCTISVVLKPTTAGAKSGTLTVTGGNGAGTKTVALSGTAIVPLFTLAPSSLALRRAGGGRDLGGAGCDADEHRDAGAADLFDHRQQHCVRRESHLWQLGGGGCELHDQRGAQADHRRSEERDADRDGGNGAGTKTVALSGTAIVPLFTLAPSSLAFGEQAVGGTSAAQDGDADEHRDAGAADLVDHRQQHCVRRESHLWQLGGGGCELHDQRGVQADHRRSEERDADRDRRRRSGHQDGRAVGHGHCAVVYARTGSLAFGEQAVGGTSAAQDGDADEHRDAGAADLVDHRQQHCVRRESHLWQLGGGGCELHDQRGAQADHRRSEERDADRDRRRRSGRQDGRAVGHGHCAVVYARTELARVRRAGGGRDLGGAGS